MFGAYTCTCIFKYIWELPLEEIYDTWKNPEYTNPIYNALPITLNRFYFSNVAFITTKKQDLLLL